MSSNLPINKQIEKYIDEHSLKLHPVQDEIIKHNDTLCLLYTSDAADD